MTIPRAIMDIDIRVMAAIASLTLGSFCTKRMPRIPPNILTTAVMIAAKCSLEFSPAALNISTA